MGGASGPTAPLEKARRSPSPFRERAMSRDAILLVEDDPDNAALTMYALKDGGLDNEVVLACDGVEALELLAKPPAGELPALILLDLRMPRMDGFETLRRLRKDPAT